MLNLKGTEKILHLIRKFWTSETYVYISICNRKTSQAAHKKYIVNEDDNIVRMLRTSTLYCFPS